MKVLSLAALFAILATAGFVIFLGAPNGQPALTKLERQIASSHPDIEHIQPDTLIQWQSTGRKLIVLDVREEDEFAVSHIENALRVSPESSLREVTALLGDQVENADILFYCSVGVRSSKLASLVADQLRADGARTIANLSGGVFRWHNEERPLINQGQSTDLVHPYDGIWKRLVEREEKTAFEPEDSIVL